MSGKKKVLVLMSGGVDSSVAAALLARDYEVMGVTLRLWEDEGPAVAVGREVDHISDARSTALLLGIPHRVLDLREAFREAVVQPFIDDYCRGRTPNPCVLCNPLVKFGLAMNFAGECGADFIATGHYARSGRDPSGRFFLMKGADRSREQSYFLYRIGGEALSRVIFPLGEMTKAEVRSTAKRFGLPAAGKEDSQEVCFIRGGDVKSFLIRHMSPVARRPGPIITSGGDMLGRHDGIHGYTVGQRRGLKVAAGRPLYVLGIDPEDGTMIVGDDNELFSAGMRVGNLKWSAPPPKEAAIRAMARIRYRHREAPALITVTGDQATVIFDKPQRAVTPGQSAVFYQEDRVLGGGIIDGAA